MPLVSAKATPAITVLASAQNIPLTVDFILFLPDAFGIASLVEPSGCLLILRETQSPITLATKADQTQDVKYRAASGARTATAGSDRGDGLLDAENFPLRFLSPASAATVPASADLGGADLGGFVGGAVRP